MNAALSESPAHAPARQARNLLERVLFTLREIPLELDREGVSQRLLRALADVYTVLDTDLRHRAHYDAISECLQAIDEAGQMLVVTGDRTQVFALDSALTTLWQARACLDFASAQAFPLLLERRLELTEQDAQAEASAPFRASRGLPELHHLQRPPVPLPVDIEPSVELLAPASAVQAVVARPTSFEQLRQLAAAAQSGALDPREDEAETAETPELPPTPALVFAYEPAIEEREMLRQLARDTLEDIASLGTLRKPIPTETWVDQAPFEQRLLNNLDYFASLGAPALGGVALYHAEADAPDAARAFACAFTLGSVQGADCVHAALSIVKQSPPEEMLGFADGFALASNPVVDRELPALLEHPTPEIAGMALSALARRGTLPDTACDLILARGDGNLTLQLVRALAFNVSAERAIAELEQFLYQAPSDEVFLVAAESLLLRGQTRTRDSLRAVLDRATTSSPRRVAGALWLLCLCGNASDVDRIVAASVHAATPQTARGLGRYGHLRVIPALIRMLGAEDEALIEAAAESLERVTGAGLFETVEIPWVADLPAEAREMPDIPSPMRKVQKVVVEPARWNAFLFRELPKFKADLRHRGGLPFLPQFVLDELEGPHTPLEQRLDATLEFRILTGVTTRFSPDDWVTRQQTQLGEMRAAIRHLGTPEGAWWMAGFPATGAVVTPRTSGSEPASKGALSLDAVLFAEGSASGDPGGLSLRDFAMLSAELDVNADGWSLAFSKYQIADRAAWELAQTAWRTRIDAERNLEAEYRRLYASAFEHWQLVFASKLGR